MLVAAVALSLGLAWQTVSPEVVEHVKAGMAAQKQGQMDVAISEFKKVTELAPTLPAAFVNLGAAYMQNHQYGEAIAPLKKSLELNSNLPGAEQMLGYALLMQGYPQEAIPHLEKVHAVDALGIAQVKVGKLNEAIANLTAALEKDPNDPELLYYLGRAAGLLSKEANDALQERYAQTARAHEALAENYAVLRQVPEAEKNYREALRAQPDVRGIHLELGQLYTKQGDWPKAEEEFRAETKLQPGDAESSYWLGNALLKQGKVKEAQAELGRADQLRPGMPETLFALGKADSLAGNTNGAESAWTKLIAVEKSGSLAAQAHFGLAGIYRKQGKTTEAAKEMEEFKKLGGGAQ
jgi:tetratricopeptide (TPR) repeat protein